jgi:hypothetical protein
MYDLPPSGFEQPQTIQSEQPILNSSSIMEQESVPFNQSLAPRDKSHLLSSLSTYYKPSVVYSSASSSSSSSSSSPPNPAATYPLLSPEINTRSHHAIQKSELSFLTRRTVAYDDIVDSEDSDSDNNSTHDNNKTKPVGYRKLLSNSKLFSKRHCTTNAKYTSNIQESCHGEFISNHFDIHIKDNDNTSIDADLDGTHNHPFLNPESEDEDDEGNGGNEDDEDVDADIDGTHNHLFLNSESEGEDDEGNGGNEDDEDAADDEGYKIKRRAQIAKSKKKSYWNKKQQVDLVKTSYCSNSQDVEIVRAKKYAGYLILRDDNSVQFPDGIQYRLK